MSMFDNYHDLSNSYKPNNSEKEIVLNKIYDNKLPKKEYNHNGVFIGYSWNYGDTVSIPYSLNKKIYVEEDSIVYIDKNMVPSSSTYGKYGQKAYNLIDKKSWVCKTLDKNTFEWIEQPKFIYPVNGSKEVILINETDASTTSIIFTICNFRKEEIYHIETNGSTDITIDIDEELSKRLIKGLYYARFSTSSANGFKNDESFLILVKDSYNITDVSIHEDTPSKSIEQLIADAVEEYLRTHDVRVHVDDYLSIESEDPVQNKVITQQIFDILDNLSDISDDIQYIKNDIDNIFELVESISSQLDSKVNYNELSAIAFSGEYEDISNKPFIPEYVSDLVNDSDFASSDYVNETIDSKLTDIKSIIPSQASNENILADRDFVNSSINNVAAFYITSDENGDPFATKQDLLDSTEVYYSGVVRIPTKNDYTIVLEDESHIDLTTGEAPTTRYIYTKDGEYSSSGWDFQYVVNNSGLTSDQLKALNSGITDSLVQNYNQHIEDTDIHLDRVNDFMTEDELLAFLRENNIIN